MSGFKSGVYRRLLQAIAGRVRLLQAVLALTPQSTSRLQPLMGKIRVRARTRSGLGLGVGKLSQSELGSEIGSELGERLIYLCLGNMAICVYAYVAMGERLSYPGQHQC